MISFSTHAKEAIKTALAVVIVYAISMQMGWDKPYWAAFSVVTVNLLSTGVTLSRGVARSSGTLLGCAVALVLVGLFPQERWWYLFCTCLFLGFCSYMLMGRKNQYFWFICGLTFLLIVPVSVTIAPQSFFQTAMIRTVQTAMGVLVYTVVAVFLWPQSSTGMLKDARRRLFAVQHQLYRAYRGLMRGEGKAEDSRAQRMQELGLLKQFEMLLNAAETDSYEVWEMRHQWRLFHQQSMALMETLGHWRTSLPEIEPLDQKRLLPNLDAFCSELDVRFTQIDRMLDGQAPDRMPQAVTLAIDKDEMRALTHFQAAAVVVTKSHLDRLEALSRSLFGCVQDIEGHGAPAASPTRLVPGQRGLTIDPDRVIASVKVVATFWASFLIWVYFDPPGHELFPMMAGVFALIIAMVPQAGGLLLFLSWGSGALFAGVLNIFVMPHLSGFTELSVMIFAAFFAMYYVLGERRQSANRMFCMAAFLILIGIENQQSYDFAQYANSTAWLMLSLALAVAILYIPSSPRPEKVFLRLLRRFFRHAEFLVSGVSPGGRQMKGMTRRLRASFYQNDLLEIPAKLEACAQKIDHRTFPANSPEQVRALVSSLVILAFHIKDLVTAHDHPQAELVEEHLLDDLRAWHQFIAARFRHRGDDPTQFFETSTEVRERLEARMARLESGIEEIFAQSGKDEISTNNNTNLYRLLGSYRGLSEAAISYAQLSQGINLAEWEEARF